MVIHYTNLLLHSDNNCLKMNKLSVSVTASAASRTVKITVRRY